MAKIDDEQFLAVSASNLFVELSDTQPENFTNHRGEWEREKAGEEIPTLVLQQFRSKIVSQQRKPMLRRSGGLSEY